MRITEASLSRFGVHFGEHHNPTHGYAELLRQFVDISQATAPLNRAPDESSGNPFVGHVAVNVEPSVT